MGSRLNMPSCDMPRRVAFDPGALVTKMAPGLPI